MEMLKELSGKWHSVYTGMTLLDTHTGCCIRRADRTLVHFVEMSDAEIHAYVETKESLDKAGAYGIQGQGGMFIDKIEGSYFTIMGLPVHLVYKELLKLI